LCPQRLFKYSNKNQLDDQMIKHIDCKSKTIIGRHWSQVRTTKHIDEPNLHTFLNFNLILKLRVNDIHEDGDLESHSFLAIDSLTLSLWVSWSHNIDNQINYLHILHFVPVQRFLFHVLFKDFFCSSTIQRFLKWKELKSTHFLFYFSFNNQCTLKL
jgi:hypothetical protein